MNKAELINQAEKLQKELDILKEKIKSCEANTKRWRATYGNWYVHYYTNGMISEKIEKNDSTDQQRYELGNYFKTKQEAEEFVENLKTKQKLKDLALELNCGEELDFKSSTKIKYYLYLTSNDEVDINTACKNRDVGQIYCLDKNFLKIAKEEVGEAKLIKLIKSGV